MLLFPITLVAILLGLFTYYQIESKRASVFLENSHKISGYQSAYLKARGELFFKNRTTEALRKFIEEFKALHARVNQFSKEINSSEIRKKSPSSMRWRGSILPSLPSSTSSSLPKMALQR